MADRQHETNAWYCREPNLSFIISLNKKNICLRKTAWSMILLYSSKYERKWSFIISSCVYISPCINHMFGSCNQYTHTHIHTQTHIYTHTNQHTLCNLHQFYKHRLRKSSIPNDLNIKKTNSIKWKNWYYKSNISITRMITSISSEALLPFVAWPTDVPTDKIYVE